MYMPDCNWSKAPARSAIQDSDEDTNSTHTDSDDVSEPEEPKPKLDSLRSASK